MRLSYGLYTVLHGDSDVEGMVSTRIYPDALPRNINLPAIIFTCNNVTIDEDKTSTTKYDKVDVTITIHALLRDEAEELAGYVRIAMDRKYGVKGSDTWITSRHTGESWTYLLDDTRWESADKGRGIYMTDMNFEVQMSDVSDYAPGSGTVSTRYVRYYDDTLTLTAGNNTWTHSRGNKIRSIIVSDSGNQYNYIPNWINTDTNTVTIEWSGATLTNARIKSTY